LKQAKYFDDSGTCDVFFDKGEKGDIISYMVVDGAWDKPKTVEFFRQLGNKIAKLVGGKPLTVKLLDTNRAARKEFTIE
jgi:hypothetical protein